jgi:hypothetical protein
MPLGDASLIRAEAVLAVCALCLMGCSGRLAGSSSPVEAGTAPAGSLDVPSSKRDPGRATPNPSDAATVPPASMPEAGRPPPPPGPLLPDAAWSPLSLVPLVNPMDHGGVGDGVANDRAALDRAINALPEQGGIVYLPAGKTFRKDDLLVISRPHVKLWAPNRQAELRGITAVPPGNLATRFDASFGGVFGLKMTSDIGSRKSNGLTDSQIAINVDVTDTEIVGSELSGSGIFVFGAKRTYIEGNFIHHTWADHIHNTQAAQASYIWANWFFNEDPTKGDDGIACVTYGVDGARCGNMEWWKNTHLGGTWGRGYAVVGGENILIHDNWAIRTAAAGILIASEPAYSTPHSNNITVRNNWLYGDARKVPHSGILVSGLYDAAQPLSDLKFKDNVVVATATGEPYRTEGAFRNVQNDGLNTQEDALPGPIPTKDDVQLRDTSVLATRDVSFVEAEQRRGLYRIHVRPAPNTGGFEQRLEYIVAGPPTEVDAFVGASAPSAFHYVVEKREVSGRSIALLLTRVPITIPETLQGLSFADLRAGDLDGSLTWLWRRIDRRAY